MPDSLSAPLRALAHDLPGLGFDAGRFYLQEENVIALRGRCHGFANCCECGCKPASLKPEPVRQPWEIAA